MPPKPRRKGLPMRSLLIARSIAGLFGVLCFALPPLQAAQTPPAHNILFILADDYRPDCVRALGNRHIKTPNLDRLVQTGMSFSRTYCMGSMEGAVCLPSRCMIQTGRSLFHLPNVNFRQGHQAFE